MWLKQSARDDPGRRAARDRDVSRGRKAPNLSSSHGVLAPWKHGDRVGGHLEVGSHGGSTAGDGPEVRSSLSEKPIHITSRVHAALMLPAVSNATSSQTKSCDRAGRGADGLVQEVTAGRHYLRSDEPAALG